MSDAKHMTIHMVGHAHIDPTWLWRWTEGYEEVRATFRSALDRMKETPAFRFTASSACFYAWVKACDPAMFDEIRARVQEGRWELAGGWWIEPDCNVPSGESFVRHGLYAQRFFEREFGMRAKVGFNPDSFGHAGTFPQLYAKAGIQYYVYMRPCPVFEMNYPEGTTFWWQANDGTRILTCNLQDTYVTGDEVLDRIHTLITSPHMNPGQQHRLGFFGVGNHGGGPTQKAIANIQKAQEDLSLPSIEFSTLLGYFEGFQATTKASAIPTINTDLQHHARGCYSVHAEIKALNRACEHALMAAERFATAAWLACGAPYPGENLEDAWKNVLYNQFHDIMAGTSIEVSYADARDQLGAARHAASVILNESVQRIARRINTKSKGNTLMVVNPLPWPVKRAVTAPPITARMLERPIHLVDDAGKPVPVQEVLGARIGHKAYTFMADIPALGYRCYEARSGVKNTVSQRTLETGRDFLENDWWRIEFDPYAGHIARLYDKKKKAEVLQRGNVLAALVDNTDTWSHETVEWRVEAGRFGNATLDCVQHGDVLATVRIVSTFRQSIAEQYVTLYRDSPAIDCRFRINWQESYTMLKLQYETAINDAKVLCDTAYGLQARDARGGEEPCQKWVDLTGTINSKPYGFALLNDSKYGYDVRNNIFRLSLLRSPAYAHHDPDRYVVEDRYPIMDQGWHNIRVELVPHAGAFETSDVVKRSWELNEPPFVHVESGHGGDMPKSASFCGSETPNVAITVLKRSEDGEDIIVRGYETAGQSAAATLRIAGVKKPVSVTFAPHEIKTLRITRHSGKAQETNFLEEGC